MGLPDLLSLHQSFFFCVATHMSTQKEGKDVNKDSMEEDWNESATFDENQMPVVTFQGRFNLDN